MNGYKKTLIGSITSLILGTSCCWLASLGVGLGSITSLVVIGHFIKEIQFILFALAIILAGISFYNYWNNRKKSL